MVRNGLRFDGWLSDGMVSTQGYERTRESGETLKYGGACKSKLTCHFDMMSLASRETRQSEQTRRAQVIVFSHTSSGKISQPDCDLSSVLVRRIGN